MEKIGLTPLVFRLVWTGAYTEWLVGRRAGSSVTNFSQPQSSEQGEKFRHGRAYVEPVLWTTGQRSCGEEKCYRTFRTTH